MRHSSDCCGLLGRNRKERFLEHVTGWLTEPKMTSEVRSAWLDIWAKCDADFGKLVSSEVEGAPTAHPAMATKA